MTHSDTWKVVDVFGRESILTTAELRAWGPVCVLTIKLIRKRAEAAIAKTERKGD